jgi:aerobic carbon-monoxide dehydrogenase large subunit
VFFGEGTGGSRSATMSGSAFHNAREDRRQGQAHRGAQSQGGREDVDFEDGIFSIAQDQPDHDHQGRGEGRGRSGAKAAEGHGGPGSRQTAVYTATVENFPNGATSARSRSTGDRRDEIVRYNVVDDVGTVLNPLLLKGQIMAASRRASARS